MNFELNIDLNNTDVVGRHSPDPLRFAFQKKRGPHAGSAAAMAKAISDPQAIQQTLTQAHTTLLKTPSTNNAHSPRCLYVHIPFCRVRCTYCNFFQYASSEALIEEYVSALLTELRFKAALEWTQASSFHAVYLGGGTPTDLSASQIERIVSEIRQLFPLTPDCEITLEGRVNRFGAEKFEAALKGGVNRFSFGVQSFDTQVRRSAKRLDDREPVLETLQSLVAYNAAPIVIDLLYGLPHQDLSVWQRDLDDYLSTGAHGVDLYQLIEMQGLPMAKMVEQGRLPMPADTAMKASMFEMGVNFMAKHHQKRLSVNHWASDNRERSLYNSLAKTTAEILPVGAGAGGNVGGWQMMQTRDMPTYIEMVENAHYPVTFLMPIADNHATAAQIKSGFDAGVLHAKKLDKVAGVGTFQSMMPLFDAWQHNGLIKLELNGHGNDYLTLTLAGQFWGVTLSQIMIDTLCVAQTTETSHKGSKLNSSHTHASMAV